MSRTYGWYKRNEKYKTLWLEDLKGRCHLGYRQVDNVITTWILNLKKRMTL